MNRDLREDLDWSDAAPDVGGCAAPGIERELLEASKPTDGFAPNRDVAFRFRDRGHGHSSGWTVDQDGLVVLRIAKWVELLSGA